MFTKIKEIWSKFLAVFNQIKSTLLGQMVLSTVSQLIEDLGKDLLDELTQMAEAKALEVEQTYGPGQGQEKGEQVIAYLRDFLTSQGLNVAQSVLHFILETVVSKLKADGQI